MKFPIIDGTNLEGKKFEIPRDLEAKYSLLIIAFKRWHQVLVDDWIQMIEKEINISKSHLIRIYEIPTLSFGYKIMRFMIDGGMRSGIPSKKVRERTITVYLNKSNFMKNLNIPNDETVSIYLIAKNGDILWNNRGPVNLNVINELIDNIDKLKKEIK